MIRYIWIACGLVLFSSALVAADFCGSVIGVPYMPMDAKNSWKFELVREIKEAGIEVDLNKLT
jgi:hypothetical protein